MKERLNYNGTRKLPKTFEKTQINSIVNQLMKSEDYWNSKGYADWGKFLKMRDIAIILTIYLLGLRPKEACCLKFEDINIKNAMVKIRGENNKVRKDRIIPLPKALIQIYKEYFRFPQERFWKGSKYLFPSFQNPHISAERLKHIFREKALKPLGLWEISDKLGSKRTLYKLRHSRASHILKKQIEEMGQPDLYAIANFLGHSDIRSTVVYLHTDEEYNEYLRTWVD